MTFPFYQLPQLPTTTVVPTLKDEFVFIQYMMRLYEDLAFSINSKDFNFFTIPISNVPTDIPNIPNFGAYLVCISGVSSTQPTGTWALAKSDSTAAGAINALQLQAGTGIWAATNLVITSTATNFQVAHTLAATTANFNIRIVGTQ